VGVRRGESVGAPAGCVLHLGGFRQEVTSASGGRRPEAPDRLGPGRCAVRRPDHRSAGRPP
jgi:hypothetical protein